MSIKLHAAAALLAIAGIATAGTAIADNAGEDEYMANCASCHGAAGMGKGPMAEFLTVEVPDLTMIAQRNDGVFPFLTVVHMVDGRSGLMEHGGAMPVWGDEFTHQAADGMAGDYSAVYEVRGRVLSLVYYLESIQQ